MYFNPCERKYCRLCFLKCILKCFLLYVYCMKVSEARSLDRDVVETGLTFAGFAVNDIFFY